jgi:arylsulfatase A-like enzyme
MNCAEPPEHRNLILISVDALRADHLGCYGYTRDTSPFLDALSKDGVLFQEAIVQWPKTQASMASMLTSTYSTPERTLHVLTYGLPDSLTVVSEILRQEGFRTMAVVANYNVGKTFGFDQGFDVFLESWIDEFVRKTGTDEFRNRPGLVKEYTNATIVTNQALKLIEASRREKFFLWLHYMEPHGPYVPPKSYEKFFADWSPGKPVPAVLIPTYQRQFKPDSEELIVDPEYYKAQYDREIRYWDDQLKRLVSYLKRKRLYERTIIVITADHGESLGDHNYFFEHGRLPYQPCSRVPLIIVAPELRRTSNHIVDEPVGLIDMVPTLMDLLDISNVRGLQGTSLLPLLSGKENRTERPIYTIAGDHHPNHRIIRVGDWKLIRAGAEEGLRLMTGREYELYNIKNDPGEMNNLVDEFPDVAQNLRGALENWDPQEPVAPAVTGDRLKHDEFAVEMLKSLGYLD